MNIPDANIMTLSASDLKERPPEMGLLLGIVRKHIKDIESEIRDAKRQNEDKIEHGIESNFPVTKMTNKRAQTYVYAAIIDQLQTNGFEVKLAVRNKSLYFAISWVAQTDSSELVRQMRLVSDAMSK